MAIVYLPSEGGISKVGLNQNGVWFGESIGGAVIESVRSQTDNNYGNYYVDSPANLTSNSNWFYKDATDYNFTNGSVIYRAIYIGADKKFREKEILGNITASFSHNGPSQVDDSVDVDILFDGKYTALSSKNSSTLDNEQDTTQLISSRTGWTKVFNSSEILSPGEYLKFWVRITFKKDNLLVNITNYNYFITFKDLTISFARTNGRLNTTKIFSTSLRDNEIVLRPSLNPEIDTGNVYKIIEHSGLTNIFYFNDQNKLRILCILRSSIIENNKYIEIDLTEAAPNITYDIQFYRHFSECCSVSTTGTTGTTGTSGTSGTSSLPTSADPCVFKPLSSDFGEYVGNRYVNDIISTNKPDKNVFFLVFNTFISENSDEFVTRYGHKNYFWNSGIINIDLNQLNLEFFKDIEPGYENRLIYAPSSRNEYILKEKFYVNKVIFQDDLLTMSGFITEDCRNVNNNNKLLHLWESDIVNETINSQFLYIPKVFSNEIVTIKKISQNEDKVGDLLFESNMVNVNDFGFNRSLKDHDGKQYIVMGPPHQKKFDHGYSHISYDIQNHLDDFSSTWSFGIHPGSITNNNTPTSGTSGTSATSGTAYSCDITGHNVLINPNQYHVVLQEEFPATTSDVEISYVDTLISVFNLHCNGNSEQYAVKVYYNFCNNTWAVVSINENNEEFVFDIQGGPTLSTTFENVITVNTCRLQVYGCYKKYIIQYSIHVNGLELINSTTYTFETTDSYIITHNFNNDFSGYISYWEVRDYLEKEAEKYARNMFKIFSNISWAKLGIENDNFDTQESSLKNFNFRREIQITNLDNDINETFVYPIVLQGFGYDIGMEYNTEIRRSVFDFTKIDINNKVFAFTYEGTTSQLEWVADIFDVDRDILVVWVRLENWNGQKLVMYYADSRIIEEQMILGNKPYRDYYAVWHMNELSRVPRKRFIETSLYDCGETLIIAKEDEKVSLIQIDRPYVNGYHQFYKSNKFDVRWDDRLFNKVDTEQINYFIEENIKLIKPNFMEIDIATSSNDYIIEADTNKEQ